MPTCSFASDLHGRASRYDTLFAVVRERAPDALFLGGDLFPMPFATFDGERELPSDFCRGYLAPELRTLRTTLRDRYPRVFMILGNDDPRFEEAAVLEGEREGLWTYCHGRRTMFGEFSVYGYAFVPPTPFRMKDWERYDVSRYVPPGCVSPEEGARSVPEEPSVTRFATIQEDLKRLTEGDTLERAIFLFHTPPFETNLDRAANDGKFIDYVPLDLHVGSIAVRRFIEARQPLVTLHGHVHESARLTGSWRDRLGVSHAFSAAHDGPELCLVTFDPDSPEEATRELRL